MIALVRLCSLLLVLLAVPVTQVSACQLMHSAPASHVMAMPRMDHDMAPEMPGHHQPAQHAMDHECIGCIAPIDVDYVQAADEPVVGAARIAAPVTMAALAVRSSAPETPPPRLLV